MTYAALLAAACLVLAIPASAEDDDPPLGRHRWGRLWVTPRLQLKDAGLDTNVFHTLQDPTRDGVVVFGPRIEGVLPAGPLRITGAGFVEVSHYRRVGDERSTDFGGEGRAELDLGRLTLFGGGGGGEFTNRLSIDVDERLRRQEKRANVGAAVRFARRFSLTAQASGEVFTFQPGAFRIGGDVKSALDRNTLTAAGQLRVGLKPRSGLVVTAEVLEDRFFSQRVDIPRTHRSYRYLGGIVVRESASGRLPFGRLLLGIREFPETAAQGHPSYRGPAASLQVEAPLGRLLRLRGLFERDVVFASSVVAVSTLRYRNAFVYRRYEGGATLGLPLGLEAVGSAGFEEARYLLPYPYPDPAALSLFDRLDHRWTATMALTRAFGESVRIGAQATWTRRVSSLPLFGYEGLRYGLSAEIVP